MGRFARSWGLAKTSWTVLKQDRELLWMPVLSFLASATAVLAVAGVGFANGLLPETTSPDGSVKPMGVLLAFLGYLALAFIALFFNAAVVAGASERLAGGDPTVGSALRQASRKAGKIFLWAIVVATVNVILQAVRERSGAIGRIFAGFAGMAWNLATYFVVPVLLFENEGVGGSVRRSGALFRKTWGETVAGEAGIGLVGALAGLAVLLAGFLLFAAVGGMGTPAVVAVVALTVLGVALVAAVFAALEGIYKAAIYRYAATGEASGGFGTGDLAGAFQPRHG